MKQILKIIVFAIYFILIVVIGAKLFFEKKFDTFTAYLFPKKAVVERTLKIGFSEPLISLSPLANDTGSRARQYHMYESLVSISPDLQINPELAISYGSVNDLTWEFRLRPDVVFHNGSPLSIDDVIFSLNKSKNDPSSGVKDLASGIKELKKIDEKIFQITTVSPDPLLLSKLSSFLIFPASAAKDSTIGTGPYKLNKAENDSLYLSRFADYWGDKPAFGKVELKTFASKEEKLNALKNGDCDIIANVPPDSAGDFKFEKFNLKTMPTLEVNFFMFNFDGIFKDKTLRQAVAAALRVGDLAKYAKGFAAPSEQFVGNGVFGYDPTILLQKSDEKLASTLVAEYSKNLENALVKITLDLPKGLEVFGKSVEEQLNAVGFETKVNFPAPQELGKLIQNKKSPFYFFGWRSDLGDALDFLTAVVHSPAGEYGQFNGGNYRNVEVDNSIELSQKTIKSADRLALMRKVMRIITNDDIIGVPLFSPEVLYGVSKNIKWSPRVDGYILAQEASY